MPDPIETAVSERLAGEWRPLPDPRVYALQEALAAVAFEAKSLHAARTIALAALDA